MSGKDTEEIKKPETKIFVTVPDSEIEQFVRDNELGIRDKIMLEQRQDNKQILGRLGAGDVKFKVAFRQINDNKDNYDNCPARNDYEAIKRSSKVIKGFLWFLVGAGSALTAFFAFFQ